MATLDELYRERQTILKYGLEMPEALENQIKEAENGIYFDTILLTYCNMPRKADTETKGSFTVMVEYRDDSLVNVGVRKDMPVDEHADIFITLDKAQELLGETDEEAVSEEDIDVVAENCIEGEDNSEELSGDRKRSQSIGFTVRFGDGKIIRQTKARNTMIEALRYMGLERASKYDGDSFKGYKLIGKEKRPTTTATLLQKSVDGWWIYVNMSNIRAINCLKGVAKMLNIPMEIILDEEPSLWPENNPVIPDGNITKGRRCLYSLNDSMPLCKNRSVLETVRLFLKNFPDAKFKDIESMFPPYLQGSYGVVRTIADINARKAKNKTEIRRWFLEPGDILHDADGVAFTVSTEWGDNYIAFQKHVQESFGWKLEDVTAL